MCLGQTGPGRVCLLGLKSSNMERRIRHILCMCVPFILAACHDVANIDVSKAAVFTDKPQRVISLDYCADQYALKFLDRSQILALSPDAAKSFSYMADSAKGLPQIKPLAENIILAKPDLVIRSYGGGPRLAEFLGRADIPIAQIGWAADLDGIKTITRDVAAALSAKARGEVLIAQMDERLDALPQYQKKKSILYMTPTGVTGGKNTLINVMIEASGYENFETRSGWHSLPLERLAYDSPDMIAAAYYEARENYQDAWSASAHTIAKRQLRETPTLHLQGAWTSCPAWYLLDAIDTLVKDGASEDASHAP